MPQPELSPAPELPPTLRVAVWLLWTQAAGLAVLLIFLVAADLNATGPSLRGGLLVTGYVALMAGILAVLGRALLRRRVWARGPALVLELLLIPIGYYLATGGVPAVGVPVIAFGLAGAGALLAPATRAALGRREPA